VRIQAIATPGTASAIAFASCRFAVTAIGTSHMLLIQNIKIQERRPGKMPRISGFADHLISQRRILYDFYFATIYALKPLLLHPLAAGAA
jgi:hypothetical protein